MVAVRVDGATVDVEREGEGPTLILMHSLLTDRGAFGLVRASLARRHRLAVVDLPGFGGSDPAAPAIEAVADRVAALFPALGLGPDTAVLGNGYGGFVAVALAERHGGLFDRLVLADTGATFPEAGRAAFRGMAAAVEAGGMAAVIDTALARLFPEAWLAGRPDVAEERRRALAAIEPRHFAAACRTLAAVDLSDGLAAIANPTLVITGALDAATPPAMGRALAAGIPGARYVELPGIGHSPQIQAPDLFLAHVAPFLAGDPAA